MKRWENQLYYNKIRQAVEEFSLIKEGDRIIVGISGGKDSMLLVHSLSLLQKHLSINFDLLGVYVDEGNKNPIEQVKKTVELMGVDFRVEMTDIKNYLDFDGKNPCYMCGRLRKGVLRRISEEEGYNVIALGHHMDDAVETFFMNMIYTGKLGTFLPGAESDGIRMIRPMVYVREEDIIKSVEYLKLPIMESKCPVNKKTTREEMKVLVKELSEKYPDLREKVVSSFKNIDRLWNR